MTYGDSDRDGDDHTVIDRRDPLLGSVLDGRFRIDFRIASGGFGAIYRATDMSTDAEVALKVLHQQLAADPMVVERFRREAAVLHGLRDPHTITAYEIGEADGTLYIVMELLRGESLYDRFHEGGPLSWQRVVHIARGVCSSLAEAHALGIVHRDLKPANIHLEQRDGDAEFVKVLDFGIAKAVDLDRSDLTLAGQMIGTIDYMSPEQMVGGTIGAASDIYTLGVVMYEMLTGKTPFAEARSATGVLAALLSRSPDPLCTKVPVPPALDAIVLRCLEREPQNRFTDVGELLDALDALERVAYAGPTAPMPAVTSIASPGFAGARSTPEGSAESIDDEATRIAVRADAGPPVLDARGPRGTPAPEFAHRPSPFPPPAAHSLPYQSFYLPPPPAPPVDHARGSQSVLPAQPPVINLAAWHQQLQPPERPSALREYDMVNSRRREAMARRIMWIAVLAVLAIAAIVVASHL